MKICGIICELNPAHNGHKYIFEKAKIQTGADIIIAVMSGDYVQRGVPAFTDKTVRTTMALNIGADVVFELPIFAATASAAYFADGGVALLDALGCDSIFFGSEAGNITELTGLSYEKGMKHYPNDILAIEYINAISRLGADIVPYTCKREGPGYNDSHSVCGDFCSASYIREHFTNNEVPSSCIPDTSYEMLIKYFESHNYLTPDDYSDMLYLKLINEKNEGFTKYFDIYEDLSDKIKAGINNYSGLEDFIMLLKSKDIAYSHICRALLHIILGITKKHFDIYKSYDYAPYARLLGFKKESEQALGVIKKSSKTDIIAKLADYRKSASADIRELIDVEINASHIYSYLSYKPDKYINELTRQIVIL